MIMSPSRHWVRFAKSTPVGAAGSVPNQTRRVAGPSVATAALSKNKQQLCRPYQVSQIVSSKKYRLPINNLRNDPHTPANQIRPAAV